MKSMYLMPSMVPTREPIRPPKIRKYRVMVIAGGTRVCAQMRRMRVTSRRTMVPSAVKLRCRMVGSWTVAWFMRVPYACRRLLLLPSSQRTLG